MILGDKSDGSEEKQDEASENGTYLSVEVFGISLRETGVKYRSWPVPAGQRVISREYPNGLQRSQVSQKFGRRGKSGQLMGICKMNW